MRIIGGTAGRRKLKAPPGSATRPTSDRVREALFAILGPPPEDAEVLDLFAGAGALGLEALSRGAARAVFVDAAAPAARVVRDNIASLDMGDRAEVWQRDAFKTLDRLAGERRRFTWVFVDPPYATDLAERSLAALGAGTLLTADAVVVVEHDRRRPLPERAGVLQSDDERIYGDTAVTLYRRSDP